MKIGFIGVGIMGKSMVRNLMKAGHEVAIYTRTKEKVSNVISEGAIWRDTVKECVLDREFIITIVGYPKDVKEVYFGKDGILENAPEGAYVLDMTTSEPSLAEEIYLKATQKNIHALDAPVTGGDIGAKNGTLAILVGGDKADFDFCLEVLKAMGQNISYCGTAGKGQHVKMCNQIAIAGAVSGVCEAMAYAKEQGIDWQLLYNAISTGAAGSNQMNGTMPKIIADDFAPGFFIKHYIKDLTIANNEAEKQNLKLTVLEKTLEIYKQLEQEGKGDLGTQALIKHFIK